jgi:hypothetical protein
MNRTIALGFVREKSDFKIWMPKMRVNEIGMRYNCDAQRSARSKCKLRRVTIPPEYLVIARVLP